ncbi:MAG: hypothetical protein H0T79_04000 [Deltaproteobacteria bacterium]|nr:hypothetical protein [Deltaproteobacteria bacterium]
MSSGRTAAWLIALSACGRLGFEPGTGAPGDGQPDDGQLLTDAVTQSGDAPDATTLASEWTMVPPGPATVSNLWAARAFSATDLWVGGTGGTIVHHDGTSWAPSTSAADDLYMLWGTATDLWAVGRACAAQRWNGTAWNPIAVLGCTNGALFAVAGTAATDVWVVGTGGAVKHWTGSWTDLSQSGAVDFWSVWPAAANDVYLVGTKGTILHYTGTFADQSPAQNVTLASIWGTGAGEYWVVGAAGTILHKVGAGAWTLVASPTTQFLYAVFGTSATDVWAVGTAGTLIHYDGVQWSSESVPITVTLRAIAGVPGGGLRIAGDGGIVLAHP